MSEAIGRGGTTAEKQKIRNRGSARDSWLRTDQKRAGLQTALDERGKAVRLFAGILAECLGKSPELLGKVEADIRSRFQADLDFAAEKSGGQVNSLQDLLSAALLHRPEDLVPFALNPPK